MNTSYYVTMCDSDMIFQHDDKYDIGFVWAHALRDCGKRLRLTPWWTPEIDWDMVYRVWMFRPFWVIPHMEDWGHWKPIENMMYYIVQGYTSRFGAFHRWGYPKLDGKTVMVKIPSQKVGNLLKVSEMSRVTRVDSSWTRRSWADIEPLDPATVFYRFRGESQWIELL